MSVQVAASIRVDLQDFSTFFPDPVSVNGGCEITGYSSSPVPVSQMGDELLNNARFTGTDRSEHIDSLNPETVEPFQIFPGKLMVFLQDVLLYFYLQYFSVGGMYGIHAFYSGKSVLN